MLKRIQLIPLIVLLWCSGISLSSGLQYGEVSVAAHLMPVAFISITYYLFRFLFRDGKRKDLFGMLGAFAMLLGGVVLLREFLVPACMVLYNEISYKIRICYGINLGELVAADYGSKELVVALIVALCTVISLYLYETCRPAVVTVLPSFLLFMLPIAADGVPYGNCVVAYGGALLIFLGMGRRGESVRKFLLLTVCTVLVCVVVQRSFSWTEVSKEMWEYRDRIAGRGNSKDGEAGAGRKEDQVPEGQRQKINFGEFSKNGQISYNGTIELYVKAQVDIQLQKLFLAGFYGESYKDGKWSGYDVSDYMDSHGVCYDPYITNVFGKIKIENGFDDGAFARYAECADTAFDPIQERGDFSVDAKYLKKVIKERWYLTEDEFQVDDRLLKRIKEECPVNLKQRTIGKAIKEVKKYFSEDFQYSIRPGVPPDGQDELEWFMFESKTGYCTHYATAAAMLFRAMGIPARVAQGYMISGGYLEEDQEVEVHDYNAHAWTEIYDGVEWIPLDVTSYVVSGLGGSEMIPGQMGQNREGMNSEQRKKSKQKEKAQDENKKKKEKKTDQSGKRSKWYDISADGVRMKWVVIVITTLCLAGAVGWIIGWRRKRYRVLGRRLETEPFENRLLLINNGLERFWKNLDMPWDYMDSSRRTAEIFESTFRFYPEHELQDVRESIQHYVLCIYQSRFGISGITEEEYRACIDYLEDLFSHIRDTGEKGRWRALRCSMVKRIMRK